MQNIENIEFQEFFLRRISHLLVRVYRDGRGWPRHEESLEIR